MLLLSVVVPIPCSVCSHGQVSPSNMVLLLQRKWFNGTGSDVRKLIYLHFLQTYRPLSERDLARETEYKIEVT